jgi:hypothetical protein
VSASKRHNDGSYGSYTGQHTHAGRINMNTMPMKTRRFGEIISGQRQLTILDTDIKLRMMISGW